MRESHTLTDYEAITNPGWLKPAEADSYAHGAGTSPRERTSGTLAETWVGRDSNFVSYVGLLLFTAFVFFRPYELFPMLTLNEGMALLENVGKLASAGVASGGVTWLARATLYMPKPFAILVVCGVVYTAAAYVAAALLFRVQTVEEREFLRRQLARLHLLSNHSAVAGCPLG